jgi:hypothetical protein
MGMSTLLLTALRQLTMVIHVLVYLAVFAVALAVVRPRHRPAGTLIAIGACMMALEMLVWPAMSWLVGRSGADVGSFYAVASFLMALWSAAAWALVLMGLIRLAVRVPQSAGGEPTPSVDAGR